MVPYAIVAGSARDGSDIIAETGSLTFLAGQDSTTLEATIVGDTTLEGLEDFGLVLDLPEGLSAAGGGIARIVDDDASVPTIVTTGGRITEGAGNLVFGIYLSEPATSTFSIPYRLLGGSATPEVDFNADEGTLFFSPGESFETISVSISSFYNDSVAELDESVILELGLPTSGAAILPGGARIWQEVGWILDNDGTALDTVREGTDTTTALAVNAPIGSAIDQNGLDGINPEVDKDWYRITLDGGTAYRITGTADVSMADSLDAIAMRLYWNDNTVASELVEGAAPEISFSAPGSAPVTLYLAVSAGGGGDWANKTGQYQLALEATGVGTPTNLRPIASANDAGAAPGTALALSDVFDFFDPNGAEDITHFAVLDRTPGSGFLAFDGAQQASNTLFERPIAELPRWTFVVGDEPDQIGFNAIDAAGAFNESVVATVRPALQTQPPLKSASDLFAIAGGKLTTLAMFADAAYERAYETLGELVSYGWKFLTPSNGLPLELAQKFVWNYFVNDPLVKPFSGGANAIVAESRGRPIARSVLQRNGCDAG